LPTTPTGSQEPQNLMTTSGLPSAEAVGAPSGAIVQAKTSPKPSGSKKKKKKTKAKAKKKTKKKPKKKPKKKVSEAPGIAAKGAVIKGQEQEKRARQNRDDEDVLILLLHEFEDYDD